ncbi:hypothetical protein ACS0TY_009940 [Phlomoides rotata]
MSTKKPSLMNVLSETSGVITAHSRHFLTLSILFIFPNTIAAIIYFFLSQPPSLHHLRFFSGDSPPYSGTAAQSQLPFQIILFLSTFLFNFCTVPAITYSTFNGFYGKPVELIASIKSILVSFLPLLATSLVVQTIYGLITFGFVVLMLVSYNGLALLGFEMDYDEPYFLVFVLVIASLMIGLLIFLQVEWYLVKAVAVLESKWGFAPLKRSSYLVKGMRGVIFLVIMLFGVLSALSVWFLSVVATSAHRINGGSIAGLVLQVVVYFGVSVVLSLYGLAANTVIFVHCKALHEESEFQIDDQLGTVYVQLPSDVV